MFKVEDPFSVIVKTPSSVINAYARSLMENKNPSYGL
jgi:hypothetical protein